MQNTESTTVTHKTCGYCGKAILGLAGLSRKDNLTSLCRSCEVKEAMEEYDQKENKKTIQEFKSNLVKLLGNFGLSGTLSWEISQLSIKVGREYIYKCIADANTFKLDYPTLDLKLLESIDDFTEIKRLINEHFKDREYWELRRLQEVCPHVEELSILDKHCQKLIGLSATERNIVIEENRMKLESTLMKKFIVKTFVDLYKHSSFRACSMSFQE